ncbi:hypothetical protein QR680_008632 [Steinernema hermaphroditum]|uniref:G-protein coupled receptors family 1 profile domain-containing protein n=1 Tax=Steinernema hermaphroditum TaxID=289476 RepID=A0AA39IHC5_9BILA|nr:hypothetical protein QR680_008632 [Steinernema hermaphroditum]
MSAIEEHVAISVTRLLIMAASIVGNTVVLLLVLRHRSLRKTGTNLLLAQLAFADLIIGIGTGIRGVSIIVFKRQGVSQYDKSLCLVLGIPTTFGIHISQTTMLAIAFDRFLSIKFPVLYRKLEKPSVAVLRFLVCTGYSIVGVGIAFTGFPFGGEKSPICSVGASTQWWYTVYSIFFGNVLTITVYVLYISIYVMFKSTSENLSRQKTLFMTVTAVLVSYFFLWFLPNIFLVVSTVTEYHELVGYGSLLVAMGSGINASTNIFIYGWKHADLRAQLKKVPLVRRLFYCGVVRRETAISTLRTVSTVRPSKA